LFSWHQFFSIFLLVGIGLYSCASHQAALAKDRCTQPPQTFKGRATDRYGSHSEYKLIGCQEDPNDKMKVRCDYKGQTVGDLIYILNRRDCSSSWLWDSTTLQWKSDYPIYPDR